LIKNSGIFILVAFCLGGCIKNPFATRQSEQPAGAVGTWETPASPDIAIRNLLNAYNEKIAQNYQSCLGENFIFSAREDSIAAEAQGLGSLYQGWNKQVETLTAQNIFSTFGVSGKHMDLSFTNSPDNPDSLGDTVAVLYRQYVIRVVVADSLAPDTTIISGLATFHLNQPQFSLWSIYFWEDLPLTPGAYDWGKFKAMYRQ
jgi:hypothetical protein